MKRQFKKPWNSEVYFCPSGWKKENKQHLYLNLMLSFHLFPLAKLINNQKKEQKPTMNEKQQKPNENIN